MFATACVSAGIPLLQAGGPTFPGSRLASELGSARVSRTPPAAAPDTLAVAWPGCASRLDIVSAMPSPPSGQCAPHRRLDRLATESRENYGLAYLKKAIGNGLPAARRTEAPKRLSPTRDVPAKLPAMDAESTDESLMLAYAAGDASAFEALYRRHRNTLYGFLMRSLGRRDQADDCFQEVWSRVINARTSYRPEARFSTWLLQIANNLLIDRHRRQRPELPIDAVPELQDTDSGQVPDRALSEFERHRQLRTAMAALPAEQRQALLMRLDQELSLDEIGAITGVGRETVKSRLRYAMDKLKELLT